MIDVELLHLVEWEASLLDDFKAWALDNKLLPFAWLLRECIYYGLWLHWKHHLQHSYKSRNTKLDHLSFQEMINNKLSLSEDVEQLYHLRARFLQDIHSW